MSVDEKKPITELTKEAHTFWQPTLDSMGLNKVGFAAKLVTTARYAKEYNHKSDVIRLFDRELDQTDFYMELYNYTDQTFYNGKRNLYRLSGFHNPKTWRRDTENYCPTEYATYTTYSIKISDLELVDEEDLNATRASIKSPIGVPSKRVVITPKEDTSMKPNMAFDLVDDDAVEKEDELYSKMTLRDYYCITHNVPFSSKAWLNRLIQQGIKFNK